MLVLKMTDYLYNEIVGKCLICNGSGELGLSTCPCRHKLAAYSRMLEGGFSKPILDFVSCSNYSPPVYISGSPYVEYYFSHPTQVIGNGLGLYLYSREKGRGKTTLAHLLVYRLAYVFGPRKGDYRRNQTYGFEGVGDLISNFINKDVGHSMSTVYVLDDLGNEDRVSWKKELLVAALQHIFHHRRNSRLPTIITSNYSPGDLSRRYDGVLDSLLEIKADGTIGGNLFRQVELGGGEDLRLGGDSSWPM